MSQRSMFSLLLLSTLLMGQAAVQAQDAEAKAAGDLKRMVGTWKTTKVTVAGKPGPTGLLKGTFQFKADKTIHLRGGPKDVSFKIELKPGEKHSKIVLTPTTGSHKGKPGAGFYKFQKDEKNTLHLFIPNRPNDVEIKEPDETLAHFVLEKTAQQ